ncbi:MAG: glycosyltransferase family A protein [Clostridia bacterium]|nr:glycosyltransferase family A protein [Clostridia bacterium]
MKHLYAVCAYKESPFLRDCIVSLKTQTVPSDIILCTSTPCEHIQGVADEFGLQVRVNPDGPGIAQDWNFAMAEAKKEGADFVTLCHQDDLYLPGYGEAFREALKEDASPLIWFCDYGEKRGEDTVTESTLLKIKRMLRWRLKVKAWQTSRFAKHRSLALGQCIGCPSVTYNLGRIDLPLFRVGYKSDLDWEAFEKLSLMEGRFCYERETLMLHRIHEESTTSHLLNDGIRKQEDYEMFCHFWPKPLAKIITRAYALSEKSNNL